MRYERPPTRAGGLLSASDRATERFVTSPEIPAPCLVRGGLRPGSARLRRTRLPRVGRVASDVRKQQPGLGHGVSGRVPVRRPLDQAGGLANLVDGETELGVRAQQSDIGRCDRETVEVGLLRLFQLAERPPGVAENGEHRGVGAVLDQPTDGDLHRFVMAPEVGERGRADQERLAGPPCVARQTLDLLQGAVRTLQLQPAPGERQRLVVVRVAGRVVRHLVAPTFP
ncbi:MAG: hypothetical protein ACRDN9_05340 [Streptosporangiaceae bacterium]